MARVGYHKRRVPNALQGTVLDGVKLTGMISVPLRDGMTRARAMALTEDMILRAKARVNFKLSDTDAFDLATAICDQHEAIPRVNREAEMVDVEYGHPDARYWLARLGRSLNMEDIQSLTRWISRVHAQRFRLLAVKSIMSVDDPEALTGEKPVERKPEAVRMVKSVRSIAGKSPLHSDVTREYFAGKSRSSNYRRALEQFREQVGDLEIHEYTEDHVWQFRNWLNVAKDEKKGEVLAGKTKNNKLAAVSSLFGFAIEKRYRNANPNRDVKRFSKNENVKKRRRLYTTDELKAIFIDGEREHEWQKWSPLLGLYAGVRITESIQLKPHDVSDEFGIWHIIIQPGRGQKVKGDRARVIPVHKELIRLGFVELAKRAKREKREWLLKDVPLVEKKGIDFNAPDLVRIMVPSQNAATQWFGRYSNDCGVIDPNVDFHAIRGLFITTGSQMGKDLSLRMELSGHSKGSGVHSSYIYAGASLKSLKAEIDQVRYPIRIPK